MSPPTGIARRAAVLLALALCALLPSCTELDGQRISLRYDAAADVLHLLLHYDGIHERKGEGKDAREQIPAFVAGGEVLLLDWFGHFEPGELRTDAAREGTPPARRELLLALVGSIRARAVGHYRDPRGRMGAVQHVEVKDASVLVRKANAALNEAILSGDVSPEWRRTAARMRQGAGEGRQWIHLDGHSLGITFAADPAEWTRVRKEAALDLARGCADSFEEMEARGPGASVEEEPPPDETPEAAALRIAEEERREAQGPAAPARPRGAAMGLLALTPVALVETADAVTFRLGDPGRPSTFRVPLRDVEDHGLDEVVMKAAPRDLDAALADHLLGGGTPADPDLADILSWGPPEEGLRVLVLRARSSGGERRAAALARLGAMAERWNRDVGLPRAPVAGESPGDGRPLDPEGDPDRFFRAWAEWWASVVE